MRYIVLSIAVALPAFAAPRADNDVSIPERDTAAWARVERLRPGQTIRVVCSDQRTWTGRLAQVSADELAIDTGGTQRATRRSEVRRIEVKSRAASALIGMGIGAAAGIGVGYAAGSGLKSGEKTAAVGLGAVLFAPAGAGIGALLPTWKTIYRGEPSGSPPAPKR